MNLSGKVHPKSPARHPTLYQIRWHESPVKSNDNVTEGAWIYQKIMLLSSGIF